MVGGTAIFSVAVSGAGPFTYQWRFNGSNLPAGIISTIAGSGALGFAGDGGAATNASFYYPRGLAFDKTGNLFIGDYDNGRVRKVDTNGIINSVAGGGPTDPYDVNGDGGPATNAAVAGPSGVALDSKGNLFIANSGTWRVRKVDTNGVIKTLAGGGHPNCCLGDNGPATNAMLLTPYDVAVDAADNVLIADTNDERIRKVNTNGIITTVAGTGALGFSGDGDAATNAVFQNPTAITVDKAGNLFIADSDNHRIRKVDTNGIITTVAGNGVRDVYGRGTYSGDGGAATNAGLNSPIDVAVDQAGNLLIADRNNNRIRKVDTIGIITTVAGNGSDYYSNADGVATNVPFADPTGVAFDADGNFIIASGSGGLIRKVTPSWGPSLTLKKVSSLNAGNYSVVINSSGGSVTSAVVALTVFLPPLAIVPTNNQRLQLLLSGPPNYLYILQTATNLGLPATWQSMATNCADASGNCSFTVTNTVTGRVRLYRTTTP